MPPPTNRVIQSSTTPRDPDVERLLSGRLHEPRRVLGVHAVGDSEAIVRVLLPNALRVRLLEPAIELERVPGTALFQWQGPRAGLASPYRIRWESQDGRWHECYDAYSFPLEIDDSD